MTGADFLRWLEAIWFDLTNPDTADLPSLVFRLIVLVLLIFFGTFLLRVTLAVLGELARNYVLPLLAFVWNALTYPFRLPFRIVRRLRLRIISRRNQLRWEREEQLRRERQETEREEAGRRERERIAALQKVLKVD